MPICETGKSEQETPSTATVPAGPEVTYVNGLLTIDPHGAPLGEVLEAIRIRAGFALDLPHNGMSTKVFDERIGPLPLPEALVQLLYGSGFNYIIQTASTDPNIVKRIFVSPATDNAKQQTVALSARPQVGGTSEPVAYEGIEDPSDAEEAPAVASTPIQAQPTTATNVPGVPVGFNLQQAAAEAHKTPAEILDELQKHQLEILNAQSPPP